MQSKARDQVRQQASALLFGLGLWVAAPALHAGTDAEQYYPQVAAGSVQKGLPIPRAALYATTPHTADSNVVYAISDAFLDNGAIYTVDVSFETPRILATLRIDAVEETQQLESIALGPDGSFWLASEDSIAGRLLNIHPDTGVVMRAIDVPLELVTWQREATTTNMRVSGSAGAEVIELFMNGTWRGAEGLAAPQSGAYRYLVERGVWELVAPQLEIGQRSRERVSDSGTVAVTAN